MHLYIDITKLRDFSQEVTADSVWQDLIDYGITNIIDDEGESLWLIAKTLNEDYQIHRANYKSYIERGMNLRMLMELRKSAILPVAEQDYWFYTNHKNAETVQEVKHLRIDFLGRLNSDYHDEDWQYMAIIKVYLGSKADYFYFDMEGCYADGNPNSVRHLEDYKRDFLRAHFQGFMGLDFS